MGAEVHGSSLRRAYTPAHVRDLRSRVRERLRRSGASRAHERHARPPRARQRRRVQRRHLPRWPLDASRSSTSRPATSRSRTRTARCTSSRTARSTTTASCGASSSAPATASARTATPRCCSTSTSSTATALPSGCAGCSPSRSGTRRGGGSCSRATASGSSRSTTATPTGELAFASELRALPRGEIDLDALEAFLAFNSIPAPLTIFRDVRKLPAGHLLLWEDGRVRLERFARPAPVAAQELRDDEEAELVEELRSRVRDSVRAHLVSDVPVGVLLSGGVDSGSARRARGRGERGTVADVLDRVRGALVRRAGRRTPRRRALRNAASRARAAPRRGAAAARPGRGVRRAVRGFVRAADVPRLRARGERRQGRALRRGRRRALRRLLHVRRRPARRSASAGWLASRGRSSSACRRRRRRRASTTARSGSSARRTCRRSSAITAGRRSSRPMPAPSSRAAARRSTRSTSCVRATTRRQGADELARLQDVDLGTYLVDDLLVKTDRASMAHSLEARVPYLDTVVTNLALALPTRHKVRGLVEEGSAAQGGGAVAPARDRARQEARLLDSGRGLAARRARTVRARDAVRGDPPAAGLLRADTSCSGCSTTMSPGARISAASSGDCSRSRSGTSGTSSVSPADARMPELLVER